MFIHLNVKSCYTFMNSIIKVHELLEKTSRMHSDYVAITDINTMHTFYDFEQACLKKDKKGKQSSRNIIHPIFGCTFIVQAKYCDNEFFNITLLAKDEDGYQNLIELSTLANTNQKQFAWITFEDLKRFNQGLFCLTGAEEGEIFYLETHNQHQQAMELLTYLQSIYKDNLYLEVSNHFMDNEKVFLESGIIDEALSLGIDYVATNNCYYLRKDDAQYRSLAVSMNSELAGLKSSEVDWIHKYASRHVDYNNEWYVKNETEMTRAFGKYLKKYPNLLTNTVKIAQQCHVSVPKTQTFPKFPIPEGYTEETYFKKLMWEGFEERFPDNESFGEGFTRQDYIDRMNYEYDIVKQMGFLGYLLIVQDYINYAKDDKVYEHPEVYFPRNHYSDYSQLSPNILNKNFKILVGPGRGSGAGSILCYLLKITNLNPVTEGLLFERFLNPDRVSMPDIDVDFMNKYRSMLIEYVQNKYGFECVSQIVTYNTLGVKSIIKNVGKVLGIPYMTTDELSKNVPKTIKKRVYLEDEDREEEKEVIPTLEDLKSIKFFKDKIDSDENIAQLFKIGKIFDELPLSTGKHACGVIIGAKKLTNFTALMEVDGVLVTQFEKKAAEAIGLLKMDFLGLITLDIEAETLRLIKEIYHKDLELSSIPINDSETFELLQKGASAKVFQLESQGMRNLLRKMKPTNMSHIVAIAALYRPGPMQFIDSYIEGMTNPSKVKYPHPLYENSSKETFGILVYQEQIMQVVQDMAGFTLGEADILRRGIGKKQIEYIDQMEIEFSDRCIKRGIPERTAKEVYAMIKKFAEYGFNKSHSACYARIAYETAYLKAHYPECFMAANCTINADNKDKLIPCLAEIKKMGIEILPPTLHQTHSKFSVEKHDGKLSIRYGLNGIEGIGEDVANHIESINQSPTLFDFIKAYPQIRTNQLTNLIYGGVFDDWGSRKNMCEIAPSIIETLKYHNKINKIYGSSILDNLCGEENYDGIEYNINDRIKKEKNAIHCCLHGHPLEAVRGIVKGYDTLISDLYKKDDGTDVQVLCQASELQIITTKKGDRMAFIKIDDEYDSIEAVVFPKAFEALEGILKEDAILIITGKVQSKEENGECKVNLIVNIAKRALPDSLRFYVDKEDLASVEEELISTNGIVEVIAVDVKEQTFSKKNYSVDYVQAINLFNTRGIQFIS